MRKTISKSPSALKGALLGMVARPLSSTPSRTIACCATRSEERRVGKKSGCSSDVCSSDLSGCQPVSVSNNVDHHSIMAKDTLRRIVICARVSHAKDYLEVAERIERSIVGYGCETAIVNPVKDNCLLCN